MHVLCSLFYSTVYYPHRVHEFPYIQHLLNKCGQISAKGGASTPHAPYFHAPPGNLDCDTPLSQDSLDAARTFCGAAMAAVDVVLDKSGVGREEGETVLDSVEVLRGTCVT